MALGAHDALGARILRMLIIAKDGHLEAAAAQLPGVELLESSHPLPDERSLRAGQRLCEFVAAMPPARHAGIPDLRRRLQPWPKC